MEGMLHKERLYTNIKEVQTMRIKETLFRIRSDGREETEQCTLHFDQAIWTKGSQ